MAESPITVVIPLFNKKCTIERALKSVIDQLNHGDEVIVIDDGRRCSPITRYVRISIGLHLRKQDQNKSNIQGNGQNTLTPTGQKTAIENTCVLDPGHRNRPPALHGNCSKTIPTDVPEHTLTNDVLVACLA